MFVRILSLIRLARVSRLVRFFNEVEKVSFKRSKLMFEIQSTFLLPADTLPDLALMTNLTLTTYNVIC